MLPQNLAVGVWRAREPDPVKTGITGCKNRVEQALRAPNWREPKEESGGACLPQVALYAAGNRTVRKDAVHIIK